MNTSHYILILFWIIYYVLHSIFAATSVKNFFYSQLHFKRYYRLAYTLIVTVLLGLLLVYQYSLDSLLLWNIPLLKLPAILLMIVPGLLIMFISVKKYFLLLSGIRSVYQAIPPSELKIDGIHQYVRHPLYSGTILVVWGFFFLFPFLNNLIAVVLLTLYVVVGIRFEEKKLLVEFGEKYEEYMDKVPALIPGLALRHR